jgi:molybdopterin-guanine dinucleotide biosynthesis protein B
MGILSVKRVIYAISGYKNSGKTTLMTALVAELKRRGHRVATIKHDGHDFEPDVPGTDSYRHRIAGAYGTAVFSKNRFMVTKTWDCVDETTLFSTFPEADVLLLEGFKDSSFPKYFCRWPEQPLPEAAELVDEIERLLDEGPVRKEH